MGDQSAAQAKKLRKLKMQAGKTYRAFTKSHGLTADQIASRNSTNYPLSKSTILRRLNPTDPKEYESIDAWLVDLHPLYLRIREIFSKRNEPTPRWDEVFGQDVPRPSNFHDLPTIAKARISSDEIKLGAAPLIEALKNSYEAKRRNGNVWKNGQILSHLCHVLELTEQWSEASHYLRLLAVSNRETKDFHFEADARLREAQAHFYSRKLKLAETAIDDGLKVIDDHDHRSPPYRTQLRLFNYKAMILSERGNHEEALKILEGKCLDLAKQKCSDAALASVYNRIGIVEVRRGKHIEKALVNLGEALQYRADMGMLSEASRTLYFMGRAYESLSQIPHALLLWELAGYLQRQNEDLDVLGQTQIACAKGYIGLTANDLPLLISVKRGEFNNRKLEAVLQKLANMTSFEESMVPNKSAAIDLARTRLQSADYYPLDDAGSDEVQALIEQLDRAETDAP